MKKVYTEIPEQKYFIVKGDIIQMFVKIFQEVDIVLGSVKFLAKIGFV